VNVPLHGFQPVQWHIHRIRGRCTRDPIGAWGGEAQGEREAEAPGQPGGERPPGGRAAATRGGAATAAARLGQPTGDAATRAAGPRQHCEGAATAAAGLGQPIGDPATAAAIAGDTRTTPANSLPMATGTTWTFSPGCGAWIIQPRPR